MILTDYKQVIKDVLELIETKSEGDLDFIVWKLNQWLEKDVTNEEAIITYFRDLLINWNCLNIGPTGNILRLNRLDEKATNVILDNYRRFLVAESPLNYTFQIAGNLIELSK